MSLGTRNSICYPLFFGVAVGREGEAENGQKNGGTSSPKCFDCVRGDGEGPRGTKCHNGQKEQKYESFLQRVTFQFRLLHDTHQSLVQKLCGNVNLVLSVKEKNESFGPFKKLCSGGGISPMGLIRLELLLLERGKREVESQIVRSGSERE